MEPDVIPTRPDVSQELDVIASSLASSQTDLKFDENPSWLLEDIRNLKEYDRLKLIKAVPRPEAEFRPRSSKKPVACDPEQLPDILVHSKAEAARGRPSRHTITSLRRSTVMSNSDSMIVSRDSLVEINLAKLNQRERDRKHRQKSVIRCMSTMALPPATMRYLERKRELTESPPRSSAAFRVHESFPRPYTAPDRSRRDFTSQVPMAPVSPSDDRKLSLIRPKSRSPSPDKFKAAEEEKKQRSVLILSFIVGFWYARNLKQIFEMSRIRHAEEERSAVCIQRKFRKFTDKTRKKKAVDVVPACVRRAIVRYRRRKYIKIVKHYLLECAKNQKSKIIRRFLYRVRRLQRLIRNWLVTERARLEVFKKYWDKVEYAYRKKLTAEYTAQQELLIEIERKSKKRAKAPIAESWSKTNAKVITLLKKVDRVQFKAAREKAFEDDTELPVHLHSMDAVPYGEFDGKVSDSVKCEILLRLIKSKRDSFLHKKKLERLATTQNLSTKSKINVELVRRLLTNYRAYSAHVVRVQLLSTREVAKHQADRMTRAQNVCFLTNPNLGQSIKSAIEDTVWEDIQRRKAERAELERQESENRLRRISSVHSAIGNIFRKDSNLGEGILKKTNLSISSKGPETDLNQPQPNTHAPPIAVRKKSVRIAEAEELQPKC